MLLCHVDNGSRNIGRWMELMQLLVVGLVVNREQASYCSIVICDLLLLSRQCI